MRASDTGLSFIDWRLPVVLRARTQPGTINHTFLSLDALRRRDIAVLGGAFIGEEQPDSQRIIAEMGKSPSLGVWL